LLLAWLCSLAPIFAIILNVIVELVSLILSPLSIYFFIYEATRAASLSLSTSVLKSLHLVLVSMEFTFLGILVPANVCIWTTLRWLRSHWPSSWPDNELLVMISLLFSILTSSLVQVMLLVCILNSLILCQVWLPILILNIQFLDVLFLKFCLISFLRTWNLLRLSIIE
jgi:hypothetical protein